MLKFLITKQAVHAQMPNPQLQTSVSRPKLSISEPMSAVQTSTPKAKLSMSKPMSAEPDLYVDIKPKFKEKIPAEYKDPWSFTGPRNQWNSPMRDAYIGHELRKIYEYKTKTSRLTAFAKLYQSGCYPELCFAAKKKRTPSFEPISYDIKNVKEFHAKDYMGIVKALVSKRSDYDILHSFRDLETSQGNFGMLVACFEHLPLHTAMKLLQSVIAMYAHDGDAPVAMRRLTFFKSFVSANPQRRASLILNKANLQHFKWLPAPVVLDAIKRTHLSLNTFFNPNWEDDPNDLTRPDNFFYLQLLYALPPNEAVQELKKLPPAGMEWLIKASLKYGPEWAARILPLLDAADSKVILKKCDCGLELMIRLANAIKKLAPQKYAEIFPSNPDRLHNELIKGQADDFLLASIFAMPLDDAKECLRRAYTPLTIARALDLLSVVPPSKKNCEILWWIISDYMFSASVLPRITDNTTRGLAGGFPCGRALSLRVIIRQLGLSERDLAMFFIRMRKITNQDFSMVLPYVRQDRVVEIINQLSG
ncbi:MAG: hypothetical protein LBD72_03030 [Puniceicoccales bacterium]|nr:hypothetical protein [Puniceicoccales bacterium]